MSVRSVPTAGVATPLRGTFDADACLLPLLRETYRARHGDADAIRAGVETVAEARADGRSRVRQLVELIRRLRRVQPRLGATQRRILAAIDDDAGILRAPLSGSREVAAAQKLEDLGFGRFEDRGFWDRPARGRVRYCSGGYFHPPTATV
jgi:hypothetical protein